MAAGKRENTASQKCRRKFGHTLCKIVTGLLNRFATINGMKLARNLMQLFKPYLEYTAGALLSLDNLCQSVKFREVMLSHMCVDIDI